MFKIIKNICKQFLSKEIRALLRIGIDNFYYLNQVRRLEREDNIAILFGTPIHNNLGDHLITLSEREFLNSVYINLKIVEIPKQVYWVYKERIRKAITSETKIFVNGGGWLGDLWQEDNQFMYEILHTYKMNEMIIFPQTIYYKSKDSMHADLLEIEKIYMKCEKLKICLREQNSYEFYKKNLPDVESILLPDIALFWERYAPKNKGVSSGKLKVGMCIRDDREKQINENVLQSVCKYLRNSNCIIENVSTMALLGVPIFLRKAVVKKHLVDFSAKDIVLTDRLHAVIFCVITNTPCIAFDNKTKKVSGVYKTWLTKFDGIYPIFEDFEQDRFISFLKLVSENKKFDWNFDLINDNFKFFKERIICG